MTSLYGIVRDKLRPAIRKALDKESLIEDWVVADPNLLGLDPLIIGRKVPTGTLNSLTIWRWMVQKRKSSSS